MKNGELVALSFAVIMSAVLVTTTALKAVLEIWIGPEHRAHDALVQVMALGVGLVWAFLLVWAEQPLARTDQLDIIVAVLLGIGGGSGAVGSFHIATSLTSRKAPPKALAKAAPKAPPVPPTASPSDSS